MHRSGARNATEVKYRESKVDNRLDEGDGARVVEVGAAR